MRSSRIRLSEGELDAVLSVANDADAYATISSITETDEEARSMIEHFESGMDKLRSMLGDRRRARERRWGGG